MVMQEGIGGDPRPWEGSKGLRLMINEVESYESVRRFVTLDGFLALSESLGVLPPRVCTY